MRPGELIENELRAFNDGNGLVEVQERSVPVDMSMPVLVVDDSRTMAQIVRNLLMLIGFRHIDNAFDGATALGKLREKHYGLVISDWNMQPMTGQMLLETIRADPLLSSISFIMVTAESSLEKVTAAKNAGASNFIVKPFSGEMLKEKIAAVFASERIGFC